jgi:hypothetical protein
MARQLRVAVAGVRNRHADAGQAALDLGELVTVGDVVGRTGIVDERGTGVRALVAKRAQHRDDRGDARAAADQRHPGGAGVGQVELALGLGKPDDHPLVRVLGQVVRDQAPGVGSDRQLDQLGIVSRARRRVAASVAAAVDLDADVGELAGAEAVPVVVGPQGEADHLRGGPADVDDLGARLGQREDGSQDLRVAVGAVRVGEGPGQLRSEDAGADPQPAAGLRERGCRGGGAHLFSISVNNCSPEYQLDARLLRS